MRVTDVDGNVHHIFFEDGVLRTEGTDPFYWGLEEEESWLLAKYIMDTISSQNGDYSI